MPKVLADYLFLAALFFPTVGLLAGVVFLLAPTRHRRADRTHAMEAKAH